MPVPEHDNDNESNAVVEAALPRDDGDHEASSTGCLSVCEPLSILSSLGRLPGVFGDAYWIGLVIDLIGDFKPDYFGLSLYGIIVGAIMGTYTTASVVTAEYCNNMYNDSVSGRQTQRATGYNAFLRWILLAGFGLDLSIDKASSLGFVFHLVRDDTWSRQVRIGSQLGALAIGGLLSIGDIKAGATNLLGLSTGSAPDAETKSFWQHYDRWMLLSSLGRSAAALGDAYWVGLIIDTMANGTLPEGYLGLSMPAFIGGICWSLFATICSVVVEACFNVNNRPGVGKPKPRLGRSLLHPGYFILLLGYLLDQIDDKASGAGFALHIIGSDHWSWPVRVGSQLGVLAMGMITSPADVRTGGISLLAAPPCRAPSV